MKIPQTWCSTEVEKWNVQEHSLISGTGGVLDGVLMMIMIKICSSTKNTCTCTVHDYRHSIDCVSCVQDIIVENIHTATVHVHVYVNSMTPFHTSTNVFCIIVMYRLLWLSWLDPCIH